MVRLRSIGVMSSAKIFAVAHVAFGILVGFIFLLIGIVNEVLPTHQGMGVFVPVLFAVFAPVIYGVLGFVTGALWAFVYNLAANSFGGLELELETLPPVVPAPTPQMASV